MYTESWIKDELHLLNQILSSPALGAKTAEEKVGAYMGTHRAAAIVLDSILDVLDTEQEEEDF